MRYTLNALLLFSVDAVGAVEVPWPEAAPDRFRAFFFHEVKNMLYKKLLKLLSNEKVENLCLDSEDDKNRLAKYLEKHLTEFILSETKKKLQS